MALKSRIRSALGDLIPLASALLLAVLLAIPASNHGPRPGLARPSSGITLVNAEREFVERKGDGEFVARPIFDRQDRWSSTTQSATRIRANWISTVYRVNGGEKKRSRRMGVLVGVPQALDEQPGPRPR